MKRFSHILPILVALIFLAACGTQSQVCPTGTTTPEYLSVPPETLSTPTPNPDGSPIKMKIGGKTISVDKVVEGPLCNDTWGGTVYVSCNIQIYSWTEYPNFLKDCQLSIAPETVVYVAHHNDAAYYNGCSCHTGEIAEP
jgi:hypothetical protein